MKSKIFMIVAIMALLVGCKNTPKCGAEDTVATVINHINTKLCMQCVGELKSIREAKYDTSTGARYCKAVATVKSGVFLNDRDVHYIIEHTEDGQDTVQVMGLPQFFNMSGK